MNIGNNGDLFSAMAPWGAQMGASAPAANMMTIGGQQIDVSQLAPAELAQLALGQEQLGLGRQQIDVMGQANKAPSAWTTGAQTFGNVAQGVAGLGSIYLGLKNMKLQKEAFNFNKGVTNTNLNNSITDYNRRLSDTLSNRALNNGQGQGWVSEQLAKYSAKRS